MDEIQTKLVQMMRDQPTFINDRKLLKGMLSDYIPCDKLYQNLILNAYDEEIVTRLKPSSDITLQALQMAKNLCDNYGITKDNAFWVVCSWCYMLHLDEIAAILVATFSPSLAQSSLQSNTNTPQQTVKVGLGVYKAGVDIPSGELKIKLESKFEYRVYYGISKNPNRVDTSREFSDQTYITIQDGQYLKLESTSSKYEFSITKM